MGGYVAYPAYRDSGVPWLGEAPVGWEVKRLKFAVRSINNKVEATGSPLPYMGLEHIESWTGKRIENTDTVSEGTASHFQSNDVLFGKLRPYLAKVHLAQHEGLASTEALVLRANGEVLPKYLAYFALSRDFIDVVDSSTFGAKMPRASWEFIGKLPLLVPPLPDQQAIARFLDWKTAQIDALIAHKEALIAALAEQRTALITQAVTKGLDPHAPMQDSGVPWLGEIPAHWSVVGLTKYLSSLVDYRGKTPEKTSDGVFLVTAKNIKNGTIDYSLSQEYVSEEEYLEVMRRGLPQVGDVLFTTEAPLGEVANVDNPDIALAQRVIKMRGKDRVLDNYFLKYWIMNLLFQQHLYSLCTGSTALGIKASKLCLLRLVLPPLEEQQQICRYLDTAIREYSMQEDIIKSTTDTLKEYRTALITNAVTGKIDVRNVPLPTPTTEVIYAWQP